MADKGVMPSIRRRMLEAMRSEMAVVQEELSESRASVNEYDKELTQLTDEVCAKVGTIICGCI